MNPRIPGHALCFEGARHDDAGRAIEGVYGYDRAGSGRGRCECGELSGELSSNNARLRWHRGHKAQVRRAEEWAS